MVSWGLWHWSSWARHNFSHIKSSCQTLPELHNSGNSWKKRPLLPVEAGDRTLCTFYCYATIFYHIWKQHGRSKQLLTLCCSKESMPTWISRLARLPTFTLPSRVHQHYGFQCLEPISSILRTFNSRQMSTHRIYSSDSWPSSKTTCYLLTVA